jgi:hypothetical protein
MKKLFQIFNRIAVVKENKATGSLQNKFAGELVKAVMNSGTARICLDRRTSYIVGDGFVSETVNEIKANNDQSIQDLLFEAANNTGLLKAVCLHVLVDNNGEVYRVYNVPVDKVERTVQGTFIYNPTKNTDNFDKNLDKEYPQWDSTLTPEQRKIKLAADLKQNNGKQLGSFVYVFRKAVGQDYYAIPPAYSGIEDILTDAELSAFELENLQNGFVPSALLTLIGEYDDQVIDEQTGLTEMDGVKKVLQSFTGKGGGRSKLAVLTAKTKEQLPIIQQMDTDLIVSALEKITDRVGRKVCRLFEVPPVLAGFEDASILGSNQTFKNALLALQHSVIKDQELIISAFNKIWPNVDFTIKQLQLIDYIPNEIMAKLTDDELRAMAGFDPLPKNTPSQQQLVIDTLNSMSPIVATNIMKAMSQKQLLELVGLQIDGEPVGEPDPNVIRTNG